MKISSFGYRRIITGFSNMRDEPAGIRLQFVQGCQELPYFARLDVGAASSAAANRPPATALVKYCAYAVDIDRMTMQSELYFRGANNLAYSLPTAESADTAGLAGMLIGVIIILLTVMM